MGLPQNLGRLAAGLTADASLNIGVGVTPSGTYKFEVGTTSKFTGIATFGSTLSNGTYTYTLPSATGTLALTSQIPSVSGTANYLPKFTGTSTIGNSQIFDNGTNVGINQPSPTRTLDILGTSGIGTVLKLEGAAGTTTYLQLAYNGATNAQSGYIGYNSSSQMQFFTNNTMQFAIASTGAATFSGLITGQAGIYQSNAASSIASNKFETYNGGSTALILDAGGSSASIDFRVTSSTKMTITSGGNVLIGTTTDNSFKLQVLASGAPMMSLGTSSATGGYLEVRYNTSSVNGYLGAGNQLVTGGAVADMALTSNTGSVLFATGGGTERMRILPSGTNFTDICIGTTTTSYGGNAGRGTLTLGGSNTALYSLQIGGVNRAYLYCDSANTYLDNASGTGDIVIVNGTGGVKLTRNATSFVSNSDERLKNINSNIENAVEKLLTLRTINFSWKTDNTNAENIGLIAQDVEKVFPQLIHKSKLVSKIDETEIDETEYLGVRYTELIPVLVAAIQEQQQQIKELQSQINK